MGVEHDGAVGADLAVVEAGLRHLGLDGDERLERAAGRVEQRDTVAQADHEAAVGTEPEGADFAGKVPALMVRAGQGVGMNAARGDIGP